LRRRLLSEQGSSGRYLEIRYERLVNEPRSVLPGLFEFIEERFDARVLDFHRIARNVSGTEEWSAETVSRPISTSSAGRWRGSLSAAEAAAVMEVAGETLRELGYDHHEH
jgi:hypothetical protein